MSRRLATVLRVAALQERLAKAEAGRAAVAVDDAHQLHAARREALTGSRLAAGSAADLQRGLALQLFRAQAVAEALAGTHDAEAARSAALDSWTSSRARHRLLEELDSRLLAERQAAEIGAAQALADDLSSARRAAR